jgi:glycopeptide antibiotics resistance protein
LKHLENRKLWRMILAAMLVPLAVIAFWPSPIDEPVQSELASILSFLHKHGIPRWSNYKFVEAAANVVLFIPLGIVASLAFPQRRWWQVGAFGLIVSGCMELGQLLFLNSRFASLQDIVTNTGGAVIGALLAIAALKELRARRLSAMGP